MVSSKETEPSDRLGETPIVLGAERTLTMLLEAERLPTGWSLLGKHVSSQETAGLDFTFKDAGKVFWERLVPRMQVKDLFFILKVFAVHGAFKYEPWLTFFPQKLEQGYC